MTAKTDKEFANGRRRVTLEVTGPNRVVLVLSPPTGSNLTLWSVGPDLPQFAAPWLDRQAHFVSLLSGKVAEVSEFSLWIELEMPEKSLNQSVLSVLVSGQHFFGPGKADEAFKGWKDTFPDWVYLSASSSDVKMYDFPL